MNLHRLDLVSLALFHRVASTGSISQGAASSHLAIAAASRRIADLEEAVGTPLFERHSRGVSLTAAGQAFHGHALRILGDVDHLVADLSDHAKGVVGVVPLWANTSAITQFLPQELASFTRLEPRLRIALQEADSHKVVLAVLEGHSDLGIFAEQTPTLGLQTRPYREDHLVLVVPRCHALAARQHMAFSEAAAEHEFVSLSQGTSLAQRLAREAHKEGIPLRVRIHVRSFDAICQMAAAGLGIAVLPELAVAPFIGPLGLRPVPLSDPWVRRRLLLGARNFAALARPAQALAGHLLGTPPAG